MLKARLLTLFELINVVKNTNQNNRSYWQCSECGFKYAEKEWAEKCEAWCREHKTCNVEITKQAIRETSG